ncbi:helix-turn-helix transcriptional regulator [Paludisphaera mucosa]|uniref:helix-turn-helix transcriptional regulator n=1 Tax=Paludisphaera mucosa TaxID=3030827 RepID=UPI0034A161B2
MPPQSQESDSSDVLLDGREVARRLGCSLRSVYRLADDGIIPRGFKLGALRRWSASGIDHFIEHASQDFRRETDGQGGGS